MTRFFFNAAFISTLFFTPLLLQGQDDLRQRIDQLYEDLETLEEQKIALLGNIERLSLEQLQVNLKEHGLPALEKDEELIEHTAMSLVYSEEHEQAKWVAHMITPDVIRGNLSRSNDFRPDPKVKTGSTVEEDYFLKFLQEDETFTYDGFGYDRGHLAPSADFRWSETAVSESYFYSNMSPQLPEFNRGKWAELEGVLRAYLYRNSQTELYVVTGPVLKKGLPVIERSINQVSIPEEFFKVILDKKNQRGIAFLMPNKSLSYPIESYAVSIDAVEELTGIDFFPNLKTEAEKKQESTFDVKSWLPNKQQDNVEPIYPPDLPPETFNTIQAKIYVGRMKDIKVCGRVVSTKLSSKGNVFINLDKKFPDQVFTIFIRAENLLNFSYQPQLELLGTDICVTGQIVEFGGTPTMFLENEEALIFMPGLKNKN